jgi:hypothetical protein
LYTGHKGVNRHDGSTENAWKKYVCGHCSRTVGGAVVASASDALWLWCPACGEPSVEDSRKQIHPAAAFGFPLQGLPVEVEAAYDEARRCMSVRAYTAAELVCRKLLMHVAVDKGATPGESFQSYVSHLEGQGYITPPMKTWVGLVREHGNKATHELEAPDQMRAESTVMFTAELLRIVYEMEHKARQYQVHPAATATEGEQR